MNLVYRADYAAFLSHFMAQQDIRYYLNGLYFESIEIGGKKAVAGLATDGHMMAIAIDRNGHLEGGPLDGAHLVRMEKPTIAALRKKGPCRRALTLDGRRLGVALHMSDADMLAQADDNAMATLEVHLQPGDCRIEGRFPNWRKVIPERDSLAPGVPGLYNGGYIERIMRAHRELEEVKNARGQMRGVRFFSHDRHSAGVVECLADPWVMAIVMPMRDDRPECIPSEWRTF